MLQQLKGDALTLDKQIDCDLMNVDRRCLDGSVHEEETLNKSQIYVTTAERPE